MCFSIFFKLFFVLNLPQKKPWAALSSSKSSEKCYFCREKVYLVQRCNAEGKFFHRDCFTCHYCKEAMSLRAGDYQYVEEEGLSSNSDFTSTLYTCLYSQGFSSISLCSSCSSLIAAWRWWFSFSLHFHFWNNCCGFKVS